MLVPHSVMEGRVGNPIEHIFRNAHFHLKCPRREDVP